MRSRRDFSTPALCCRAASAASRSCAALALRAVYSALSLACSALSTLSAFWGSDFLPAGCSFAAVFSADLASCVAAGLAAGLVFAPTAEIGFAADIGFAAETGSTGVSSGTGVLS